MVFQSPFRAPVQAPVATAGAASAAVPWSLSYDGNDFVDCGGAASLKNLHAADFTIDVYFQLPNPPVYGAYIYVAQCFWANGWRLRYLHWLASGRLAVEINMYDGAGVYQAAQAYPVPVVLGGAWCYVRARRSGNNLYASLDTTESAAVVIAAGGIASTVNMYLARYQATYLTGRTVYVHIWNTNKGALGAVPTTPVAVDANTVGRWIHSNGAGAVLTDSSGNGNHGAISGAAWSATVPAGWTI